MKNFLSGTTPHMFIIGIFMLLLLIPLSMVQDLVNERQRTKIQAVEEVRRDWAYTQYVGGPVLVFPYTALNSDGVKIIRYLNASPDTMNVEGVLNPDILYRSIYEIPVYRSEVTFSGKFTIPDFQSQGISESSILWDQVFVSFFISDLKGIGEETRIVWDAAAMVFKAGPGRAGTFSSGLHTSVPIKYEDVVTEGKETVRKLVKRSFSYKVDLKLKGSESFFVVPIGKQTSVSLSSSWNSPKFTGTFLPETRTVTDEGFKATWNVLSYNRDFPDVWSGSINNEIYSNIIGTELFMEINTYSKTDRTVKYGFLFILFTFIVFFFAEVFSKVRIHPIHYTLVGVSLVIFYILLLSFAEHMNFNLAYLIAMLATSGLISFYSFSIYRKKIVGFITTFELLLLYGFVFVILHMYEYALLAGSVGVFVILAVVMYFSRSIDWYTVLTASSSENKGRELQKDELV